MRYFKCKDPEANVPKITILPELTVQEKKDQRQSKFLNVIASILFFLVWFASFACFMIFITKFIPNPQKPILVLLYSVGLIIYGVAAFAVSFLAGVLVSSPIFEKSDKKYKFHGVNVLSGTCVHLREYYGWQESCIVTKCYESSDKRFNGRDVCIFAVGNELRITANLKNGFSDREKDPGCYAFDIDEISLKLIQGEKFPITELIIGDTVFLLGRRAKAFMESYKK